MEKILVTTDLSINSKAGMRYAIQLARQRKAELVFLHLHQVLRASSWGDREYQHHIDHNREILMKELSPFVRSVYRSVKAERENCKIAVHHDLDTTRGIMEFADSIGASYICISTRGAGAIKRLIGTNTGNLILKSKIPVICVPSNYRIKPITHLLYACDMTDYERELKRVVAFARPIDARVELLHMSFPYEFVVDNDLMAETLKKKTGYKIDVHYERRKIENSLLEDIEQAVRKSKPSILAMFTNQNRSFFERIFLSSKAEEYSFSTKLPLLVFNKQ